jgi:alpha-galactosidase
MRSVPLWRSDTSCTPGHADWNQAQAWSLSQYIPFHTGGAWTAEPYDFRSLATAGAVADWDYRDSAFPIEQGQATMAEARENAQYWYGDVYPLTSWSLGSDQWAAYRLGGSEYAALAVSLRGLKPAARYEVEFTDEARSRTTRNMTGEELMGAFELRIPSQPGSPMMRYRQIVG